MDIVFDITKRTKTKARKRRVKHEKKWLVLRIISFIAFPISIYAFVKGMFFTDYLDFDQDLKYSIIFTVAIMIGICARALILGFTSRWINDRFNERIWIKNGRLFHFLQKAVGGGLNTWTTDLTATLFILDINSITNARYDSASGRMEFDSKGEYIFYSDFLIQKIQKAGVIDKDITAIFYDYTEPSLYECLKLSGVNFKEETINFSLTDARI